MNRRIFLVMMLVLAAASSSFGADTDSEWQKNLEAWRSAHEAEIKSPEGWLTVVGLKWLHAGLNTVGASASSTARIEGLGQDSLLTIRYEDNRAWLVAPSGGFPVGLTLDGASAKEAELLFTGQHASVLRYGSFTLTIIQRGQGLAIRVKNAKSDALTHFSGLRWYPPDSTYRITAKWVPYDKPKEVAVQTVVNTTTRGLVPGEAQFEVNGKKIVLLPVGQSLQDQSLFFVVRDETSKTTTYQASRFLHAELPDHGLTQPGTVVLDFNQLVNPPCAFTDYATCPLPLDENKLTIALPVGELRYEHE